MIAAGRSYAELDATEHGEEDGDVESKVEPQPLNPSPPVPVPKPGGPHDESEGIPKNSTKRQKLLILLETSVPLIMSFFLSFSGSFINLIFCGHLSAMTGSTTSDLGPTPAQIFAGISLANMWANVTYKSIIIGLSGAIETLGSQNNGAGNYREVGLTFQRAVFVLSITCVPCFLSWQFSGEFFRLMRIEEPVCRVIADYLKIRVFEMPIGVIQTSYEKYLMSLGVMHPPLYGEVHFNLSLILLNLLFLYGGFGFGYKGLGYAYVLSLGAALATQVAMAYRHPSVVRTMQPFDWKEIVNVPKLREFVGLGLPGMIMLLSEWWAYEVLSIFAGLLGTPEVSAQTIILSTAALAYMFPLGTGIATASLVGNALGAGNREVAIDVAHLAFQVIICLEVVLGIVIYFFGHFFVQLFTDEVDILKVADSVMPFLSIFVMADGLNAVGSGVLRGCGKQFWGGVTNVVSYYLFGLPCAWLLCFNAGWRVPGLMMGLFAGTLSQVLSLLVFVYCLENYTFARAITVVQNEPLSPLHDSKGGVIETGPRGTFIISEAGDSDDEEPGWD